MLKTPRFSSYSAFTKRHTVFSPLMSNKHNQEDGEGERDVVDGVEPFGKNQSVFLTVHAQGPAKY